MPIESLCTSVTSGGTPSRNDPRFWEEGVIPWVKTGELRDWYVDDPEEKITLEALANSSAKLFPQNTVLMAMYGDGKTITSLGILRNEAATNQACCAMIADAAKCHFLFLFYSLKYHRHELLKLVVAGAQRNLSGGIIRKFKITWFQLPVQKRIVDILSAYDDLIENNRRRMALLEDAARQLYREWFVRLRFPGYEHTHITHGLPDRWRKVPLGEITTKIGSGFTPRGGESTYILKGTPLIRSLNVYDDLFVDEGLAFVSEDHAAALAGVTVEPKDILLNITGASVARCCMAPGRHLPARVNQHVMIIRVDPEKADSLFVHKAINSDERKRQLLSYAQKGATREALTKEMVAGFEITLPSDALMRNFGEIAGVSFRQRENLAFQNQKLRAARDLLLPRLMSGEIPV